MRSGGAQLNMEDDAFVDGVNLDFLQVSIFSKYLGNSWRAVGTLSAVLAPGAVGLLAREYVPRFVAKMGAAVPTCS